MPVKETAEAEPVSAEMPVSAGGGPDGGSPTSTPVAAPGVTPETAVMQDENGSAGAGDMATGPHGGELSPASASSATPVADGASHVLKGKGHGLARVRVRVESRYRSAKVSVRVTLRAAVESRGNT
jgi:hypothetical protein